MKITQRDGKVIEIFYVTEMNTVNKASGEMDIVFTYISDKKIDRPLLNKEGTAYLKKHLQIESHNIERIIF